MQAGAGDSPPIAPIAGGSVSEETPSSRVLKSATPSPPLVSAPIQASEAPTITRLNLTGDRATTSSLQRKGGNLVLFVKSNENDSEVISRSTALQLAATPATTDDGGTDVQKLGGVPEKSEKGATDVPEDFLSLLVSTFSGAFESVGHAATGMARKPLMTAALVLLYFILLDMVLLNENDRLNRVLRRTQAAENDALIMLSASLMHQLHTAREELESATKTNLDAVSLERLLDAQQRKDILERVCNRSVGRLHGKLFFPGTVDQLFFLLSEHATYEARLQDLARRELLWTTTMTAAHWMVTDDERAGEGHTGVLHATRSPFNAPNPAMKGFEDDVPGGEGEERSTDAEFHFLSLVSLRQAKGDEEYMWTTENRGSPSHRSRSTHAGRGLGKRVARDTSSPSTSAPTRGGRMWRTLFQILKNKFVALALISVLLIGILRMG